MAWMREINDFLEGYQASRYGTKVRLLATKFPKPTISINVFYRGRKTLEMPIEDLNEFIEDLQEVVRIIDDAIESGEIDLDEIEEQRKEFEERREEEDNSRRKRRKSSSSRSSSGRSRKSRRKPKRD